LATASTAAVPDGRDLIFGFIASPILRRSTNPAKYSPPALILGSPEAIDFAVNNVCFSL
jgi:hypothetical protein